MLVVQNHRAHLSLLDEFLTHNNRYLNLDGNGFLTRNNFIPINSNQNLTYWTGLNYEISSNNTVFGLIPKHYQNQPTHLFYHIHNNITFSNPNIKIIAAISISIFD